MNELDCMVAHVNCGNAVLPGVEKLKHTYLNVHGSRGKWVIRLEAVLAPNMGGCDEVVTITGYRKTINYLKKCGWQWAKLAK